MSVDLSSLNPPQREAVLATEGPVLVLAGAGSGKTRVITYRVAHLLDKGVSAKNILAVTFTNKAAAEMAERVTSLVGERRAKGLTVSTFHAFGLSLLKRELHRLGYPRRFAIVDASDQVSLVKRCLKEANDADRRFDVRRLIALISRAKMNGGALKSAAGGDEAYEEMARDVHDRYQRALFAMAGVDFDDLITLPAKIWQQFPQVLEEHRWQYRYLLIDEYQDTNAAQFRLVKLLGGEAQNVCAVGDDDQSIYGWRGAEVEHILRFEKQFRRVKEIRLEQNYRSTGHILSAANAIIAKNPSRKAKKLWTDRGDGEKISTVAAPTEEDEAKFIADEVVRLHYDEKRKLSDFAILYRTNTQARPLEEALHASSLAFDTHGGLKFFDRKEVKDAVAYFRLCHNVQDDVSLARIVNTPARGIGDATMEKLHARARERGLHLFSVMKHAAEAPDLAPASLESIARFVELIERYQRLVETNGWSHAARELCREVDLWSECKKNVESARAASRKVENLEGLLHGVERYEEQHPGAGVAGYLARVSLDSRDEEPGQSASDAVTLMTLHSAKGLEWPVVFLCGVEEDLLPHSGMQGEIADPEEERRLAYVGITRARERLYLTRAATRFKHGRSKERTPSRFLTDIPGEHLEAVDLSVPRGPREEEAMQRGHDFFARMKTLLADLPAEEDS